MKTFFPKIFLFLFLINYAIGQVPVHQKKIEGSYTAKSTERDSILDEMVSVYLRLILNSDSTFTFSAKSEKGHCDSNRAGFWSLGKSSVILDFIGEDPLELSINEGHNFLSLINKEEALYLVKQQAKVHPGGQQQDNYRPSKKKTAKDTKCPRF